MSEEEPQTDIEEEPQTDIEKKIDSPLKINSWDDLFKALCILKGIDPNQVQSMTKFMDLDSKDERSFFPNQLTSLAIAQLRMYGRSIYPNSEWNEYELLADVMAVGFMGYHGFKSNQWVEATSGQQNLEKIRGLPEDTQKTILSGMFGRGKTE